MIPLLLLPVALAGSEIGLVEVRPFTLEAPYAYRWHADRRPVDQGLVVVLEVDPVLARPVDGPHPVLYVGDTPAERLSWSATAPALVVLVPGPVDLARSPVYWGDETLPEQVDATHGAAQLAAARATPFSAAQVAAATGPSIDVADIGALYEAVAPIVTEHAPLPQP